MNNEKEIVERIPTPLLMPTQNCNLITDLNWCYFVFYSDRSTGIDFSKPTEKEIKEALENFFYNLLEE